MATTDEGSASPAAGAGDSLLEGRVEDVRDYFLERLIMLSDGMFAVALTLLAVELHPPAQWDGSWAGLWMGVWQKLGAYFVTFCAVGAYWMSHRRIFLHIRRADGVLTILNLLALGLVTLLPAGAEMLYEYGPRGNGLILYMTMVAAIGVAQGLVWGWAALGARLVSPEIPGRLRWLVFITMMMMPPLIMVAVFFGLLSLNGWVLAAAVACMLVLGGARRRLQRYAPARRPG